MKTQLPNLPSKLIRLAMEDLKKAEASENYDVNMGVWHAPRKRYMGNPYCDVCFGGAVMAFSLDADILEGYTPGRFSLRNNWKLSSLDDFRRGNIHYGLKTFFEKRVTKKRLEKVREHITVTPYATSREEFYKGIKEIIDHLEEHGF